MKRALLALTVFLLAAPAYAAWWELIYRVPNPFYVNR